MDVPVGPAAGIADRIHAGFVAFHRAFDDLTARASPRFEGRDWHGTQADAFERLGLYSVTVHEVVAALTEPARAEPATRDLWRSVKAAFAHATAEDPNSELARTFFNSVSRRIFSTIGVDAVTEFTLAPQPVASPAPGAIVQRYRAERGVQPLLRAILEDHRFAAGFHDLGADVALAADHLERDLAPFGGTESIQCVEMLRPVFFRNKAAYLIGRIHGRAGILPLVLPLLHAERGVVLDAVLVDTAEVSILFSFTRSYFHVAADCPRELIAFLKTILPEKPIAELYIALGFDKHGKTELYRTLRRQLEATEERFETAPGDRGLVMLVFTLPQYDRVFKVIRDTFAYPKHTTARQVIERYRLVFERDRVGRLVEAQEFGHMRLERDQFAPELLTELLEQAAHTIHAGADGVVIERLYMERKVRPLNLYLREAATAEAHRAIVDYGHAIKDLAAANIFPGDFLLKNFGVTRHGRVVFYDYDELCLLTDCNFRRLPAARSLEQELAAEPWFTTADNDIFPEEFRTFLDLHEGLLEVFERHHGDVFTVEFWRGMQERHARGEVLDFFPYPERRRLRVAPGG